MLVHSTEKANSGVCNERRYMKTDASSYLFTVDNSSSKIPLVRYQSEQENILALAQLPQGPSWPGHNFSGSTVNCVSEHAHPTPVSSIHESCGNHFSNQADIISQENSLKLVSIKKDICDLQDSIASIASEPLKVSLRKDFLGRDSSGRVYWAFYWPGARPWILANGSLTSQERASKEFAGIAESDKWMSYESDNEIEELLGWLRETHEREKELRESILQLQSSKLKDEYTENHVLSKGESNHLMFSNGGKDLSADFLTTKATTVLEKRTGLCAEEMPTDLGSQQQQHANNEARSVDSLKDDEESENSVFGLSKSCIINDSSLRPLTGRASQVLRILTCIAIGGIGRHLQLQLKSPLSVRLLCVYTCSTQPSLEPNRELDVQVHTDTTPTYLMN